MKVVILAGGFGTRLAEETDHIPKPMVEIGGKPIIWHIMKTYGHYGLQDFIICLGYKGHVIKEYFNNYRLQAKDMTIDIGRNIVTMADGMTDPWRVSLIDTGIDTLTGGRLKRIASHVGSEAFCMTYGDGIADIDITALIRFHRSHGKLATITVHRPPSRFGIVELDGDQVTGIREKDTEDGTLINVGFCVLESAVFDFIDGDKVAWEQGPLQKLASAKQLMAFHHRGFWHPMDTLRDKRALEELWRTKPAWKIWP
ncbi:MAG TPA: glucose-1-phosphate cytidylyltransferase [Nitrospirales bacterium]|jgi:glucose-1-phosphate cytidylyltransferase